MTNTDSTDAATVSDTILAQLGGSKIFAMAFDAYCSWAMTDGYRLSIVPALRRGCKLTHVDIKLASDDTYTVSTWRVRGVTKCTVVQTITGVHADALRATVEALTGLRLGLGFGAVPA